jgi:hypothetical protein
MDRDARYQFVGLLAIYSYGYIIHVVSGGEGRRTDGIPGIHGPNNVKRYPGNVILQQNTT